MRVVFFNCFHNGDIHVSRGFVRKIMEKARQQNPDIVFDYSHRNPANLLADIPNLNYHRHLVDMISNEHNNLDRFGDMVFFNTWYAQQRFKFMNRYGITFDSLYVGLDDTCKQLWGFSLSDITTDVTQFFPIIDYSKFEIESPKSWLHNNTGTKVLVENGPANSGQAVNFPMTPIIINLANKHPDKTFILTHHDGRNDLPSNVVYSSNIINKSVKSDLNEVSFLSTHCDMVIGRASGVWSFTLTQENLFQRKMKYLCFSNLVPAQPNKFWLGEMFQDQITYSSEFITKDESNPDRVQSIIEEHL